MRKIKNILKTEYNEKSIAQNIIFLVLTVLTALSLFLVPVKPAREMVDMPLSNVIYGSFYEKQFDAFLKGQLNLDLSVDWRFSQLDNPYDPVERAEKKLSYYWDHAYYDGKYYSYFGIAPILTVYYPSYLLSGAVPSTALLCLILALWSVLFLALAYREAVCRFAPKCNFILMLFGLPACVAASGVYLGVLCSDAYYVAVLSALACVSACIFFAFAAIRARNTVLCSALFFFSGASGVLAVMSRPSASLMCAVMVPSLICFIIRGRKNFLRHILPPLILFSVPIICGAAFVMWFNAARFSSPFDFGANYQLTVSDISQNKIDIKLFLPSVLSYFFKPFIFTGEYPYIAMNNAVAYDFAGRFFYSEWYIGAFCHGAPAALFAYPFLAYIERDKERNATFITLVLTALAIAFSDFCLAGVNMRYIYDIAATLALFGTVSLLALQKSVKGKARYATAALTVILTVLTFCSVFAINSAISGLI